MYPLRAIMSPDDSTNFIIFIMVPAKLQKNSRNWFEEYINGFKAFKSPTYQFNQVSLGCARKKTMKKTIRSIEPISQLDGLKIFPADVLATDLTQLYEFEVEDLKALNYFGSRREACMT